MFVEGITSEHEIIKIPSVIRGYIVKNQIGVGSSCVVFQCYQPTQKCYYALKVIKRSLLQDKDNLKTLEIELRMFERLKHPNIVNYIETIYLEGYIVVVMELFSSGVMRQHISTITHFPTNQILRITHEILSGLCYLHSKGIAHRDIKPDNIGFDGDMHAKLLDFGLCKEDAQHSHHACGTPFYVAPEVITCDNYDATKADIWSFGITMHAFTTGSFPFKAVSIQEFNKMVQNNTLEIYNIAPHPMNIIIDKCLRKDPNKRFTAAQLMNMDFFNFLKNQNMQEINLPLRFGGKSTPKFKNLPTIVEPRHSHKHSNLTIRISH